MGRAGQAWVEAVQNTQDFQWLFRVGHRRAKKGRLIGADVALRIARGEVFQVVGTTAW
ncbi:MAG: hypothetical protein FD149_2340 [Rhodospirillaceae bacterium]|nr:MAG: hypothetical protein FD149_2340 [Rhodospirillaceae bacterium]